MTGSRWFGMSVPFLIVLSATGCSSCEGMDSPSIGRYNVYYGQFHSHTEVSDGSGTPDDAYRFARDTAKLDFFSIADHASYPYDSMMTVADYEGIQNTADSYNQDGTFVTFWGFEWTSDDTSWGGPSTLLGKGHITILNSPDFCRATDDSWNDLNELANWMSTRDVVAFFNHPGEYNTTFDDFGFSHTDKIVGMELWNRSADYYTNDGNHSDDGGKSFYDEALGRGWYIGASGSQDNHGKDWGTTNEWRLAILAPEKTRTSLFSAMKARRFYSSRDKNLALSFKCNEAEMGSRVPAGSLNFTIEARDGNEEAFTSVQMLKNGAVIETWTPDSTRPRLTFSTIGEPGDYFYVRVYQSGEEWAAISSPIFID